jgi:hypothetical protein
MTRLGLVGGLFVLALAGCADDGRELRSPTAPPPVTTVVPLATLPAPTLPAESLSASTVASSASTIEVEQLFSPANATAEMTGSGARVTDPVTVDDEPADVLRFDVADDGTFLLQVWIVDEGAHTVCVADACGRVYTLAPDAESPEEITAMIEAALPLARGYLDWEVEFPGWTVEIGGALAGTGGSTDVDNRTVTVYRNRGRTVDEFVRTILHELGHVVDAEYLDDESRSEYTAIRGYAPDTPWRADGSHRIDQWARQPSEDFAELMVAIWTEGRWEPRTDAVGLPTLDQIEQVLRLVDPALDNG